MRCFRLGRWRPAHSRDLRLGLPALKLLRVAKN
jgi:hypothetical protein